MTRVQATILLVVSQLLFLAATVDSLNSTCGDGLIYLPDEDCDDANMNIGDGCSASCTIENGWCCGTESPSDCAPVLFDLNEDDGLNITDGNPVDAFNTSMRFLNPDEFVTCVGVPWDTISVAIMALEGGNDQQEGIDVDIISAIAEGRVDNNPLFTEPNSIYQLSSFTSTENNELETLLGQEILEGIEITPGELIDTNNSQLFADVVFSSLSYELFDDTLFQTRNICIVVEAGIYNSSGCLNLSFIGFNDDNPVITYTAVSATVFFEDYPNPVHVVNGTIQVSDKDHPNYLLHSAETKIIPYNPGELLNFSTLPPGLTQSFDPVYGILTVTGYATPQVYTEVFENLLYNNLMMEPVNLSKIIELTVNDGLHTSEVVEVFVVVINSNDIPNVVASASLLTVYYEGNGTVIFDPAIQVVDPDPNVMIMRLEVNLTEVKDGAFESISITTALSPGLTVTVDPGNYHIRINGSGTPTEYSEILQTLTYTHADSDPGNPTAGNRTLLFYVMDETSARDSSYTFYVQPVNDAPILYFSTTPSNELKQLIYLEDDPYLFLADDIVLEDVDTDITMVTVELSGLLNKEHDIFSFNETLANDYGVDIIQSFDGVRGTITLNGSARAEQYEQILQSFTYINSFMNNSVLNGIRTASLYALDSMNSSSQMLTVYIDVTERNDEPDVQIDEIIHFTEGSMSIEIVTLHLVDIMDEELNNISRINITLIATNGALDPLDIIFVRSPFPFTNFTEIFDNQILVEMEGSHEVYEEVLRSIRYINQEEEPTFYANVTTREILQREVIISLTDNNVTHPSVAIHRIMINLTLINDNTPVIIINITDTKCLAVPPTSSVHKRDTSAVMPSSVRFHRRRLQLKRKSAKDKGKIYVPKVLSAYAQHSNPQNCLANITVIFNSNTSTPPVEVQRDLEEILFLEPSSLYSTPHYGWWIDYRTLVINFDGCFSMERMDQFYLFFEEQPSSGNCDKTSMCSKGICYHNNTGCPFSGPVTVAANYTPLPPSASPSPIPDEAGWDFAALGPYMIAAGVLALMISVIATLAYWKMSRNPESTKSTLYKKPKPSKCQLKLSVETIVPHLETSSWRESQPNKFHPRECAKGLTPDTAKQSHSLKFSPNKSKRLPKSKGVKKCKSTPSPKENMIERKDREEKKVGEETNRNGEEGKEGAEGKPLQCFAVTNGVLPESVEDKSADVVADVPTMQFASTSDDSHRLHPDSATPSKQNKTAPLSTTIQQCQCTEQCHCASPMAPRPHTPCNSRQKQSATTPPTKVDLQSRDKSCS